VTLALLFTIALGIGSNTVVHGLIQGLVRGRSPHVERVVSIFDRAARGPGSGQISYSDYQRLRTRSELFEWVGAAQVAQRAVLLDGRSAVLTVAAVTPDLERLFGLQLEQGVILSHAIPERVKHVEIGGVRSAVAAVAPPMLSGLYTDRTVDLWMTLGEEKLRRVWGLARLRPGVTAEEVNDVCCRVLPYTGRTPETLTGLEQVSTVLQLAAGFVLLIACANVASFQLGRATSRSKETSIRVALGASRGRLTRGVLVDSLVVSLLGGAAGLVLGVWTARIVPGLMFEQDAEFIVHVPDAASVLLPSAAALGIIIACGLVPVFETAQSRPGEVLRRESTGGSRRSRSIRTILVVLQMAGCCVLVISAGYLHQGFRAALQTRISRGLSKPILATVQTHPDVGLRYFQDIERAARSIGGVTVLGWTTRLPGNQPAWQSFHIEQRQQPMREINMDVEAFAAESVERFRLPLVAGRLFGLIDHGCGAAIVNEAAAARLFGDATVGRTVYDALGRPTVVIGIAGVNNERHEGRPAIYFDSTDSRAPSVEPISFTRFRTSAISELEKAELSVNVVSPEYFTAVGFSVMAGRVFPDDPQNGRCRVGVVNPEAAELYLGGDPTGGAVIDETGRRTEIIGVVQSARLGTLQRSTDPAIYLPMVQDYQPRMTVLLAAPSASDRMLVSVRSALEAVPGSAPPPMIVRSLEAYLSQTGLAPLRVATVILSAATVTAVLLSVLGLYGTLNETARRRRRDMAVRIALGARPRDIVAQVLGQGGRLALAGAVAGIAGSFLISPLLSRVAMLTEAPGAWVWMAGPIIVACVVLFASTLPARRSLLVDPLRSLRDD
jgi:ABC-type antimicrobial peptide transport system permease subunit